MSGVGGLKLILKLKWSEIMDTQAPRCLKKKLHTWNHEYCFFVYMLLKSHLHKNLTKILPHFLFQGLFCCYTEGQPLCWQVFLKGNSLFFQIFNKMHKCRPRPCAPAGFFSSWHSQISSLVVLSASCPAVPTSGFFYWCNYCPSLTFPNHFSLECLAFSPKHLKKQCCSEVLILDPIHPHRSREPLCLFVCDLQLFFLTFFSFVTAPICKTISCSLCSCHDARDKTLESGALTTTRMIPPFSPWQYGPASFIGDTCFL